MADRDDRSRQLALEIDNNKILRADLDRLNDDLRAAQARKSAERNVGKFLRKSLISTLVYIITTNQTSLKGQFYQ